MAALVCENGIHHCAIFHGDEHGASHKSFKECKLHPAHKKFMTVDEFLNNRPSEIDMFAKDMVTVRNYIDRTVRTVVSHTSAHRPDTYKDSKTPYPCVNQRGFHNWIRCGTGYLVARYNYDGGKTCPCFECTNQTIRQTYHFVIKTATHVVFDEDEARCTMFEFFYDSEKRRRVEEVHGITVLGSDLNRLETDRCFVVCGTHDSAFAAKLDLFCIPTTGSLLNGVLVSHPHGVSKRISVGDDIQCILRLIPGEKFVKFKKGMDIRFLDCHDAKCVAQSINRLLGQHVIDVDFSLLLCDLTIYHPENIIMETDDDFWRRIESIKKNQVWWNFISPGTQFVSDDGKQFFPFPYEHNEVPRVKMEVFGRFASFFDNYDKDRLYVYSYSRYNMASCPGSSGAHVKSFEDGLFSETGGVHFGNSGDCNTSSLIRVHPSGGHQESEGNSLNTKDRVQRIVYKTITREQDISWDA